MTTSADTRRMSPLVPMVVDPDAWSDAPWMPWAFHEMGQREIPGPLDNARIQGYYASCVGAQRARGMHDETPWCAAFVNWCMEQAGIAGTKKLNARSFMRWGRPLDVPTPGCVVVFWRESRTSAKGHVGFYAGDAGSRVLVLGGNQGNSVCIKPYPKARLLGYRAAS